MIRQSSYIGWFQVAVVQNKEGESLEQVVTEIAPPFMIHFPAAYKFIPNKL